MIQNLNQRTPSNLRIALLGTTALVLFGVLAAAQDYRATVSGQVSDPSGSAIPSASITATSVATNTSKSTKSDSQGHYAIPYLEPGVYTLEVTANGFQKLRRESITLEVAAKLDLPLQLTLGQMTQEVTVVGQQEVIETGNADRGLVFDPIKTQEYPLNGRQTYMLMALTPGVVFTQEQFGASGFSGTRGWDVNNSYKINGARTGENLFLLNGAPISDQGGTWQLAPNVEAVQEFKVMTNTYDASYGRFGGGVVNTTLRSGSNNWHGDVFEYFRNRLLDANTFQNNANGLPKGFHNQHQFGGVVGGALRKDKDFVFFSFEGWQEVVPFPALSSTPPALLRDGQHFTDFGYKIYDPLTTHLCNPATEPCQGQTYIANQFPGNVIPQSRISPIGAKILGYFPNPNGAGITSNFVAASNLGRYYYEQPMARWDHVFGPNDRFYAIVTWQQGFEYRSTTGFPRPAATGNTNNERADRNVIVDHTHVISSTAVFDVRASFGRFVQTTPGYSDLTLTATGTLGMTKMIHSANSPGDLPPSISVGEYSGPLFGSSGNAYSWRAYDQWNFAPSLALTRGRHTVRTGFELNYVTEGTNATGVADGQFTFGTGWTQQLPARRQNATDGSGVATLLLGYPTSGGIAWNDSIYRTRPYYGFYVQDDWKVNQRLSLNLGLRYDMQIPWLERYNRENRGWDQSVKSPLSDQVLANWANLKATYDKANPNSKYPYPAPPSVLTGGFLFPGVNGQPRRLYNTDHTNIQPRIGLAYRIREKTVIRTGAGIYYQTPTQGGTTSGFQQSTPYLTSLDGGITPSAGVSLNGPYSLVQPFPTGLAAPMGSSLGVLTNVGNGVGYDPAGYRIPRTYQYSFGIQQELWRKIVAEVTYTGNYQNHINFGQNLNHEPYADQLIAIQDPSYYSRTLPNPFYGIVPVTSSLGGSATTAANNLIRPDPIYQGITNNLIQQGRYRSDMLQVRVEQRALANTNSKAGVLTWVLSYAFGKAFEQNHRLNDWNTNEQPIYEVDNTDKTHNLTFSGVYDLPFGNGKPMLNVSNRAARLLIDDWRIAPIFSYSTGNPTGWPNLVLKPGCDWHAVGQNENRWFNNDKTCYTQTVTNSLRVIPDRFPDIRDPSVGPSINLAIEKTFPIGERYRVQIRGESFNLTNHPQRPGPDTSFTNQTFGQLPKSQLNFPRLIQLAAKFYF